jgi:hypothetical protein
MTDVYPALMEQVFDVAEGEREPDIHHHGQVDYFAGCFEVTKWIVSHEKTVNGGVKTYQTAV